ncbi:MAG: hypothetical protein RMK19_07905 [Bacteroidia bacterium]|nr:hypothetical protein [Bacteroidia bacterium]MDW8015919.1 hypothetical protein [Bacteroidia bacterium]
MTSITLFAVSLLGGYGAKAQFMSKTEFMPHGRMTLTEQAVEIKESWSPWRRNYRTQMARAYFGKRAGCRRGGFCGR